MYTDRCGNTGRQKCCAKGSGKEVKIQQFMYRVTTNVEREMYDYTNNNWSHWNSNEKLKEKFGSCTGKTLDRFTTKDSYTWNITHNTESTAVWSLKPERWGSPLVQEKYQEEKSLGGGVGWGWEGEEEEEEKDYYYYYYYLFNSITHTVTLEDMSIIS